jgi:phosphate transport system substrate-binding protein
MKHTLNSVISPIRRSSVIAFTLGLALSACNRTDESGKEAQKKTTITNIGSDTMVNLAIAWAEAYGKVDPTVSVEVNGGGSGQGVAALIQGTCDIANCSRTFEEKEIAELKQKRNADAKEHMVGYDALSIFVHKDNPINEISLEQLGDIYRADGKITKWSDIGVALPGGKGDEIIRVSRQNNSGTYHYFKEAIIGKTSEYKLGTLDMNGSKDVVELIAKTPNAIGYSGMGYATADVKQLKVSKKTGQPGIVPSIASTLDKTYPIARPLFMYTAGEAAAHIKRYLDWIVSDAGQEIVKQTGYVPLPKK